ncbi:MAG TPA: DNA translocase FtsK, partial [Bacteroidales bacterium]|nr:DNA translocase FtsK [Bacteroidales bacterium]
ENHYLAKIPNETEPIVTDVDKVVKTLYSLTMLMDTRYDFLKQAGVKNIVEYNKKYLAGMLDPEEGHEFMPYIVLVIDEFADLIMTAGKEVELPVARIAQLARAVGIHVIIATQRPSVDVITGKIKANFPARIAFRVSSKVDSRTILDVNGAEQLVGRGDMLFAVGSELTRIQCAFIDTPEIDDLMEYISQQPGFPEAYILPEPIMEGTNPQIIEIQALDPLIMDAAAIIISAQQGSISLLQRKLQIGHNRAGRLMDQLEALNIVGPQIGSKPRDVLISDISQLEQILNNPN